MLLLFFLITIRKKLTWLSVVEYYNHMCDTHALYLFFSRSIRPDRFVVRTRSKLEPAIKSKESTV